MSMNDAEKILDITRKQQDEFLCLLQTAVELESPTYGDKAASDKCAEFFMNFYKSLGFTVSSVPQTECGDHVIAEYGQGDKTLLIIGHYDTVFPIGSLQTMPWKIEGQKAYGPGTFDMKGGLLQAGFAVKALQTMGIAINKKIRIMISGDEESGSRTSREIFKAAAAECDWALIPEPGLLDIGAVKTARKGRAVYKLIVKGRSSHAGNFPEKGISAIQELAAQTLALCAMNDFEAGVSVSPSYITSGVEATAMIPGEGFLEMDVRAPNMLLLQEVDAAIRLLKPTMEGVSLELLGGIEKPPLEFSEKSKSLFEHARKLAEEMGVTLEWHKAGGGTDGNFIASTGIPILDGLGMTGDFLHNPKEYINIDHIPFRTALVARLIQTL